MIMEFAPASDFVPSDLDATKWERLEPLYRGLIERPLKCKGCLIGLIMDRSELDAAASEAGSILSINMTCRTSDPAAKSAYLDFVQNVHPRIREAGFELDKKIVGSPFAAELDPERYGVLLRDLRASVELFRQENVPLDVELTTLDQEYSQICGAMTVTFRGEERTLPQMSVFNEDPDRATREEAWRLVAERRGQDADQLDAIFERMLELRARVATNAGLADYRAYAWKAKRRFDYTPEDCAAFARGVKEHVTPLLRRVMAERAARMRLPALRPWDGQVDPDGRPALRPFSTAEELVERTARAFRRMDPSLAEMFEYLREVDRSPRWGNPSACLDLESRKGKAPGGYQANRDRIRKPFIFMNAAGVQRDVETLFHEAGHAFHSMLTRSDPLLAYRSEIPLEFAEVASMSMELTAHPFLGEFYGAADADRARRQHLEGILAGLAHIAIIDQFQHWLYTTPGHTRAERHERYAALVREYGPGFDWSGLEPVLLTGWQRILHLYGVPFYFIEYGIAQLGALQVWLNYRRDPAGAIERYKAGLSLGASRPLPELFRAAGLPFDFGPATISRLTGEIRAELARLPA